jgi:hypothetical protein
MEHISSRSFAAHHYVYRVGAGQLAARASSASAALAASAAPATFSLSILGRRAPDPTPDANLVDAAA